MADYGIKVTRDGYDVASATILQQSFNSQKNCLKLTPPSGGTATSTASGVRTVQVAHGLGIVPGFLIWFDVDSSGRWYPGYSQEDVSGKSVFVNPYTDGTYLNLYMSSSASATIRVYYFLFVDPGD